MRELGNGPAGVCSLDDPELAKFIKESASLDMVVLVGLARRE